MKEISLIITCDIDGGIGYKNTVPWCIPDAIQKFNEITMNVEDGNKQNAVIMGRKTWEMIGCPLTKRVNIIITRKAKTLNIPGVALFEDLNDALVYCNINQSIEKSFIIGGASLYNQCITDHDVDIYLSVLFYNNYKTNIYIDIKSVFNNFRIKKDDRYELEHMNKIFASYICTKKFIK